LIEANLVGAINSGAKLVNINQGRVKLSYPNTNGAETPIKYKKEYFSPHRQKRAILKNLFIWLNQLATYLQINY
jgi:hypothetical protein